MFSLSFILHEKYFDLNNYLISTILKREKTKKDEKFSFYKKVNTLISLLFTI